MRLLNERVDEIAKREIQVVHVRMLIGIFINMVPRVFIKSADKSVYKASNNSAIKSVAKSIVKSVQVCPRVPPFRPIAVVAEIQQHTHGGGGRGAGIDVLSTCLRHIVCLRCGECVLRDTLSAFEMCRVCFWRHVECV